MSFRSSGWLQCHLTFLFNFFALGMIRGRSPTGLRWVSFLNRKISFCNILWSRFFVSKVYWLSLGKWNRSYPCHVDTGEIIAFAKLQVLCDIVEENNLIAYFSELFLFLMNKLSREEFSLSLPFILPPTVSKVQKVNVIPQLFLCLPSTQTHKRRHRPSIDTISTIICSPSPLDFLCLKFFPFFQRSLNLGTRKNGLS